MVTSPSGSVERGRREVLVLAGFCVVALASLTVQVWRVTGHFPGWLYPGSLLAVIPLALFTYSRRRWARLLLVVVSGLIAAVVVLAALGGFAYSPPTAIALLIVAFLLAVAAWRLQTSPHVDMYLRS